MIVLSICVMLRYRCIEGGVAIMVNKAVQKVMAELERTNEDSKKRIHQALYSQSADLKGKTKQR